MIDMKVDYKQGGKSLGERMFSVGSMSDSGAKMTLKYQRTLNQGNYNSLVVGVEVSVPVESSLDETFEEAAQKVETYYNQLLNRVENGG